MVARPIAVPARSVILDLEPQESLEGKLPVLGIVDSVRH